MYLGCAGWSEIQARTGLTLPMPERLVYAAIEPTTHRAGERIDILWRVGDDFHWLTDVIYPGEVEEREEGEDNGLHDPSSYAMEAGAMHWHLLRAALDERLAAEGLIHHPRHDARIVSATAPLLDELRLMLASRGERTLYATTCTDVSDDQVHTSTVALYDELDTAILHAKAAKAQAERLRDKGEIEDVPFFRVDAFPHRLRVPEDLAAFLPVDGGTAR